MGLYPKGSREHEGLRRAVDVLEAMPRASAPLYLCVRVHEDRPCGFMDPTYSWELRVYGREIETSLETTWIDRKGAEPVGADVYIWEAIPGQEARVPPGLEIDERTEEGLETLRANNPLIKTEVFY